MPIDGRCGLKRRLGDAEDLDGLHALLMCAAKQGCPQCVECSEEALKLLLNATGKADKIPPRGTN